MRIIVAGGGDVGGQVAAELAVSGNDVVVVDRDPSVAEAIAERGVGFVAGDATTADVLEAAGGLSAEVLVACTGRDEENLVISTLAKRHLEIPRVVARVNDLSNRWLFDDSSGVDAAISSAMALVALIEEATGSADTVRLTDLPSMGLVIVEANVGAASAVRGWAVEDLHLGSGAAVAAVVRRGRPIRVEGSLRLRSGDRVLVLTPAESEHVVRSVFYPGGSSG